MNEEFLNIIVKHLIVETEWTDYSEHTAIIPIPNNYYRNLDFNGVKHYLNLNPIDTMGVTDVQHHFLPKLWEKYYAPNLV